MSCNHNHCNVSKEEETYNINLILNIIGIAILIITIILRPTGKAELIMFLVSYVLIGYEIIINGIKNIFKRNPFDENFLMTIATIGAFIIGEYIEGIAVLIFYCIGEYLQNLAINKSRTRIEKALNLKPEYANLKINDDTKIVNPQELNVGDIIILKAGEKVPVDGIIIKGKTSLDVSALSGESMPKDVVKGDKILSGSINLNAAIEVRVSEIFENSTISKIINLIESANNSKSKSEKFITRFAKIYTPIIILIAVIIAIFPTILFSYDFYEYLRRALIFLVVSCPCALVLSIPLGYFSGIGTCGKNGILIKGSNFLDDITNVKTIIFDKTGTLTKGSFNITKIVSKSNMKEDEILKYITLCESYSNHPIAKSILNNYGEELDKTSVQKHEEISGYGIRATILNEEVLAGNYKLLDIYNINYGKANDIGTIIYLVIGNEYKGYVTIADEIKDDSPEAIHKLKEQGINDIIMFTGDSNIIAENIAERLKLTRVYSELLPQDKVKILNEIKHAKENEKVVFVGDGINDSPVLKMSDIGISMGAGSDIAIESSDIVLMTDEPSKIVDLIKIARKTKKIVIQNIIFAISVKVIFLILSGFGYTTMWEAVFADVGVSLLAVLNSSRIMKS